MVAQLISVPGQQRGFLGVRNTIPMILRIQDFVTNRPCPISFMLQCPKTSTFVWKQAGIFQSLLRQKMTTSVLFCAKCGHRQSEAEQEPTLLNIMKLKWEKYKEKSGVIEKTRVWGWEEEEEERERDGGHGTDSKTCLLSQEMKRKVHFTLARILPPAHLNALFCHWPEHMLPSYVHCTPHLLVSFHPQ